MPGEDLRSEDRERMQALKDARRAEDERRRKDHRWLIKQSDGAYVPDTRGVLLALHAIYYLLEERLPAPPPRTIDTGTPSLGPVEDDPPSRTVHFPRRLS